MRSVDNLSNCVGFVVMMAIIGCVFSVVVGCSSGPHMERFQEISKGVIKDRMFGDVYYIDTLLYAKAAHQHKDWYFADNAADAMIIEKIMNACHSSRDVEAVQDMIHIYGAKKKNIASLVDGRDGYEISTLYERCARNRYDVYWKLEVIDSLTVAYLKNGGEKLRADIMIDEIEMQSHTLKVFDDMRRVEAKRYYSDAEE